MVTIKDPRGIVYLTNQYDSNNRVIRQTLADNSTFQFAYTLDGQNNVTQATLTDQRGYIRQTTFNSSGFTLTDTRAVGTPQQQATTYNRDSSTNLVSSVTDALSRTTAYTYDSLGNKLSITRLSGTPDAVTTSFTYEPTFSQVTSVTDPWATSPTSPTIAPAISRRLLIRSTTSGPSPTTPRVGPCRLPIRFRTPPDSLTLSAISSRSPTLWVAL